MQQTFQCYRCGAQNYIGQACCWNCQTPFQWNCPSCGTPVQNTMANCPYCRALLPWSRGQYSQPPNYQAPHYQAQRAYQEPEEAPGGRNTRLIAILLVVFLVLLGGGIVFAVNNFSNSNQSSTEKAASNQQPSGAKPGTTGKPATEMPKPPVISNVKVSSITKTSAVITWTTDKPSSSQVNYGTSISRDFSTDNIKTLVTQHSVTLTYLKPATTYHYIVRSADEKGSESLSDDSTFKTTVSDSTIGNEF